MTAELYCAIDRADLEGARALALAVSGDVDGFKLGLEFFTANGPEGVRAMAAFGRPIFLDLKLHDIPNTVAGAVRAAAGLGVALLTVHCSGGPAMLRRAIEAAHETRGAPALIGVTVLTSLDEGDLETVGQNGPIADQVLRLAELAQIGGLGGVVCSAHEIGPLRARSGPGFRLVVPGIRPEGGSAGDQKRVLGPAAAVAGGADILVVGRPITAAADPAAAAAAIRAEMTGGTVVV